MLLTRAAFSIAVFCIALAACDRAPRCPDLTGEYAVAGEDGWAEAIIRQSGCESAHVEWVIHVEQKTTRSPHDVMLDGTPRPDIGWYGDTSPHMTAARFVGDTLVLESSPVAPKSWQQPVRKTFVLSPGGICTGMVMGRESSMLFAGRKADSTTQASDSDHFCRR